MLSAADCLSEFAQAKKTIEPRLDRSNRLFVAVKTLSKVLTDPAIVSDPWVQANNPRLGSVLRDSVDLLTKDKAIAQGLLRAERTLATIKRPRANRPAAANELGFAFILPLVIVALAGAGVLGYVQHRKIVETEEATKRAQLREKIAELKADAAKHGVDSRVVMTLSNLETSLGGVSWWTIAGVAGVGLGVWLWLRRGRKASA